MVSKCQLTLQGELLLVVFSAIAATLRACLTSKLSLKAIGIRLSDGLTTYVTLRERLRQSANVLTIERSAIQHQFFLKFINNLNKPLKSLLKKR